MTEVAEPIEMMKHRRRLSTQTGVEESVEDDPVENDAPLGPPRSWWRRLAWVGALGVLIATSGGAWWVGSHTQSPDQAAGRAAEPVASWITAPVEFRVLSATLVTRGDVQPLSQTTVGVPASVEGTPVLTRTVVTAGDIVAEGDRVVEVSGRPVFAFQGETPVYRSLQPGMTGDDVTALQQSLVRLGYAIAVEETGNFGATTKAAVAQFYEAAGYQPIPTSATYPADRAIAERAVSDAAAALSTAQTALGNRDRGPARSVIAQADEAVAAAGRALNAANANVTTDVALAQGNLDVAKAARTGVENNPDATPDDWNAANIAVSVADVALGDAIRDTRDAVDGAQAVYDIAVLARRELDKSVDVTELQAAVDSAIGARDDAFNAVSELDRVNGPTVPQGEVVFVTTTPSRVLTAVTTLVADSTTANGDAGETTSANSLVTLATGGLVVNAAVPPDQVGLVTEGLDVEILDELTNATYPATVATVAASPTTGTGGQLGHTITITPDKDLPDTLAGTNVRVTMTAASTDTKELVVPLAAVSSGADGSTRVNIIDPATNEPVVVKVTAGLSAGGFVAITPITPDTLSVGSDVIVGR